jgi:hypothetical protein
VRCHVELPGAEKMSSVHWTIALGFGAHAAGEIAMAVNLLVLIQPCGLLKEVDKRPAERRRRRKDVLPGLDVGGEDFSGFGGVLWSSSRQVLAHGHANYRDPRKGW